MEKVKIGVLSPDTQAFPGEGRAFTPGALNAFAQMFNGIVLMPPRYGKAMDGDLNYASLPRQALPSDVSVAGQSNVLLSLKYPAKCTLEGVKPNTTLLLSMAHFHTRPARVQFLTERNIPTISLDGIVNDEGIRLVEDLKSVAWNGANVLFAYLEQSRPEFLKRNVINVLIMGSGAVGKHAADALIHLGDRERRKRHRLKVLALTVGSDVTGNKDMLLDLLEKTDVLVDATNRADPSVPIVENQDLARMKKDAVILDLSVDCYDPLKLGNQTKRAMVKAIEGTPTGDAEHYLFPPDDPAYGLSVPEDVPSNKRRLAVSHGSWPSIRPLESMRHYEAQLIPLVQCLAAIACTPLEAYYALDGSSVNPVERALYRGSLRGFNGN